MRPPTGRGRRRRTGRPWRHRRRCRGCASVRKGSPSAQVTFCDDGLNRLRASNSWAPGRNEGAPAPDRARGRATSARGGRRDVRAHRLLPLLLAHQADVGCSGASPRGRRLQRPLRDRRHDAQAERQGAHRRRGAGRPRPWYRRRRGRRGRDRRVPASRPWRCSAGGAGSCRPGGRHQSFFAHPPSRESRDARPAAQDGLDPPGQAERWRVRDLFRAPAAVVIDTQLLAFAGVSLLLAVTPGPDMAVVTKNALAHGRRGVLLTTSGIALALSIWVTATAVGLSAVLRASGELLFALKLAGAVYLAYLGVRTLLDSRRRPADLLADAPPPAPAHAIFRQGFLSAISNPKLRVFFVTFLPQV